MVNLVVDEGMTKDICQIQEGLVLRILPRRSGDVAVDSIDNLNLAWEKNERPQ